MTQRALTILREVLSLPTAPFREEAVADYIRRWADRRGTAFGRDAAGNVVVRHRRGRRRGPRWVFTAHMDHPGFVARRQAGRLVWADFRGSVDGRYIRGGRVRFFPPGGGQPVGAIIARRPILPQRWWACRVELEGPGDVPPGTTGMWDLPPFVLRNRRVSARGCDDLAGTAVVLAAIDRLAAGGVEADVTGLLTRAEEAGFIGALAACRLGAIPADALVVGVEASAAQAAAPLGGGGVIRVGDRLRTFDPPLTAHLSAVAAALARRRGLRFNRQLMPGGTCESTVFCLAGLRAAALALPLGNYHNMGPAGRIAAEQVDVGDFLSLVALLTALPQDPAGPAQADRTLRRRLQRLWTERWELLDE